MPYTRVAVAAPDSLSMASANGAKATAGAPGPAPLSQA